MHRGKQEESKERRKMGGVQGVDVGGNSFSFDLSGLLPRQLVGWRVLGIFKQNTDQVPVSVGGHPV